MLVGIMSGSLTSTPAFSSAKMTAATVAAAPGSVLSVADAEAVVSVGYGIAYIFGVVGVVLFVQLIPRITHANMEEERAKIHVVETGVKSEAKGKRFEVDPFGFFAFAFVIALGVLVGAIKIPLSSAGLSGTTFSLTSTGGVLLCGLVFGHLGHIGPFKMNIKQSTLSSFREFGLVLFLLGAGVAGGMKFVQYFKPVYFLYGVIITLIPMLIGFFFTKYVLKLSLLNNLGAITGGMTSTPALGTLISTAGTDEVASAYAATYPIALIAVVLVSQFLILLLS
jgi:putative transport protein